MILGMPWIKQYNPIIDWQNRCITFNDKVIKKQQAICKHQQTHDPPHGTLWGLPEPSTFPHLTMLYIEAGQITKKDNWTHNLSKTIQNLWENQVTVHKIDKSTEIAIAAN